ncbi:MAG: hypothetical protein AAB516_00930 [Patescibacteria group bacterium]
MNILNFQLVKGLTLKVEITPHRIYAIPRPPITTKAPTHIGVYSGKYRYYDSSYPADFKGSCKKSKSFYKIPKDKTHFVFQECKNHPGNPSGFIPGKPTFVSSSTIPATPQSEFRLFQLFQWWSDW